MQSSLIAREAEERKLTLDNYSHALMQSQQREKDKLYKKRQDRESCEIDRDFKRKLDREAKDLRRACATHVNNCNS